MCPGSRGNSCNGLMTESKVAGMATRDEMAKIVAMAEITGRRP